MGKVRIGIIGIGSMGRQHAKWIVDGSAPLADLTAVCDINPEALEWAKENLPKSIKQYDDYETMIRSGEVEAVLIATPHYDHPTIAVAAFKKGLHVLSEKPAGVYTGQVKEMNQAAKESGKVFGLMFNQRMKPVYQKMRELVRNGEIGEIVRTDLVITDWFRTQNYYDNGDWRGTWKGEGGGVLLNQCPHNLDIWQWICGMPEKTIAFCDFGKRHNIEVEDEVTAYVKYKNGATGTFVASTGEAPGTNRFEIVGERGKLLLENGKLTFWRTRKDVKSAIKDTESAFEKPEIWRCEIPTDGVDKAHSGIINNFSDAILNGAELLAPGEEGINSLQLSNGMLLSSWDGGWVDLPLDDDKFYGHLQKHIAGSRYKKPEGKNKAVSVEGSF